MLIFTKFVGILFCVFEEDPDFKRQSKMATNNPGNAAAEREQKMLESSMENLSNRLTDVRNSLTSLIAKVENDPNLNWSSFLDSFAMISGQLNSLMRNIKADTNRNPPISYRFVNRSCFERFEN